MKEYTAPKINVCEFSGENVVTVSALLPTDAKDYVPMEGKFESSAFILDWQK